MDQEVVGELIDELVNTNLMMLVIDSGGAVSEMHSRDMKPPEIEDGWATIESVDWHIHLDLSKLDGVQFVEAVDNYHDFPKLFYVRLSDADGGTLLRFYFPNPWLDEDENVVEFQPEKLSFFESFRDRYVGRGGIVFVER
jgi:hypothetical protein